MVKIMMQLNSKNLEELRNVLGAYRVARFKIADKCAFMQKDVKSAERVIAENLERIARIESGDLITSRKVSDILAENAQKEREIAEYKATYKAFSESMADDISKGEKLVTKDIIDAVKAYDIYDDRTELALTTALVQFFMAHGATDCNVESVMPYIKAFGSRSNSTRGIVTDGKLLRNMSKGEIVKIFLGALCDEPKMAKVLPTHKFEFKYEKIEKKAKKDA